MFSVTHFMMTGFKPINLLKIKFSVRHLYNLAKLPGVLLSCNTELKIQLIFFSAESLEISANKFAFAPKFNFFGI